MYTFPNSVPSGIDIYPQVSGQNSIGTISNPFKYIYANAVYISGSSIVPTSGTVGNFVHLSGDTMTGNLTTPVLYANNMFMSGVSIGNAIYTGLLSGGQTTAISSSGINISSGIGVIINRTVDPQSPVVSLVNFGPFNNVIMSGLSSSYTQIGITSSGTVSQIAGRQFTSSERTSLITLSTVLHPNSGINGVQSCVMPTYSPYQTVKDMNSVIGPLNANGNVFGASGTSLSLTKSAGQTFNQGINYYNDATSPNISTDASMAGVTFQYKYRNGSGGFTTTAPTTTIVPGSYDDGTGTLASVGAGNWTIQRIYYAPITNKIFIHYGQATYTTFANAKAAYLSEPFSSDPTLTQYNTFRCWLIVRGNTTNLADTGNNLFITADKFGSTGGVTTATTTLQAAYDNSVTPEIVTDSTRDGLTIKEGAGVGANLFEGMNSNGNIVFSISASGNVVISGTMNTNTISGGSIYQNGIQVLNTVSSSGTGVSLFDSKTGGSAFLNSISGLGNVTVSTASNGVINISGTQYTLPTSLTGLTLVSSSVISGTTISGNTINQGGVQVLNTISSSGTGVSLYNSKVTSNAILNSISGVGNVTVSTASNGVINISGTQYTLPSSLTGLTLVSSSVVSGTTISGNTINQGGIQVLNTVSSSGAGVSLFDSKSGGTAFLNSISGLGIITVSTASNGVINISGSSTFAGGTITSSITPNTSGTLSLGTTALPFSGINAINLNGTQIKRYAINEVPAGIINSINKDFVFGYTPIPLSTTVVLNGIIMTPSGLGYSNFDYTLSGATISFITPPLTNSILYGNYQY